MIVTRWLITALAVHLLGALIIGISAMGPINGIAAGIMFAVFGCFYLVITAPFVLLGQLLIDLLPLIGMKILSGIVLTIVGSIMGYYVCFKVGGVRPNHYAIGYAITGGIAGIAVLVSSVNWPRRRKNEGEQVAP